MRARILLLFCCGLLQPSDILTDVKINYYKSYFNPEICSHYYCVIENFRGNRKYSTVSANCDFKRPVDVAWIRIETYRKVDKGYQATSFGTLQKFCNISHVRTNNSFMDWLLNWQEKYLSGIRCPLQGNVSVNKLPTALHFIGTILNPAEYLVRSVISEDATSNLKVAELNISLSVSKSNLFA